MDERSDAPAEGAPSLPPSGPPMAPWRPGHRPRRGSGLGAILLVALVSAVIGGLVTGLVLLPAVTARLEGGAGGGLPVGSAAPPAAEPPPPNLVFEGVSAVEVAERLGPSVVGIINEQEYYDWIYDRRVTVPSSGSGVIIDPDGLVVTNNHVVENASKLTVILSDGTKLDATVVGRDPYSDLAVVRVAQSGLPAARFGDSDRLRLGEPAIAIGNPLGMQFERSVTMGVISGLNRDVEVTVETPRGRENVRMTLIQTDAAINPGNSGGALANAAGEVIGINTVKISLPTVEGMGFAIPSNRVKAIMAELIAYGRVRYPWLGVEIMEKDAAAFYRRTTIEHGVLVTRVVAGSPAQAAGIEAGDIIVKLAGEPIETFADLRQVLFRHRPGDQIAAELQRGGRPLTLQVTLGERPPQSGG